MNLLLASVLAFISTTAQAGDADHVADKMPPVPEMNIRHRFGEKTYLKVALEPSMDVPFARLQLGFKPWAEGVDGTMCDVPPFLASAAEGAACDVALLDRMREVQRKALGETDPDRRLVGRKLGAFLVNLDPTGDPDLLHLEALTRLRAAEKALGEKPTPLASYVRDSVAGKLSWQVARRAAREASAAKRSTRKTQKAPTPEMEKWTKAEMSVNSPVSFAPGLSVTWYNGHLLRFYVVGAEPAPKDAEGWPGGSVSIRLWVPDTVPESWLVYDVDHSLEREPGLTAAKDDKAYAPNPCRWLYEHEHRFPEENPLPASAPRTVWKSTRLWGRDYPFPVSASGSLGDGAKPWRFEWTFVPGDFIDQRPGLKPGFRDSWFAEVRHTDAKGAVRAGRVRILWPAGGPDGELVSGDSLPFETYQTKTRPLYEQLHARWGWGEDDCFYRDFAKPALDADCKLLEKTYTHCGSLPPIKKEVPAVRLKFYRELSRIVFVEERIEDIRKAYLVDLLEGREPMPPKLKLPSAEKKGPAAPDADDGEKLELDEEEF